VQNKSLLLTLPFLIQWFRRTILKNYFLVFDTGFATVLPATAFFGTDFIDSALFKTGFLVSGFFFVTTMRSSTPLRNFPVLKRDE
jgi:hypothetical protein